jgi:hypothetical protein
MPSRPEEEIRRLSDEDLLARVKKEVHDGKWPVHNQPDKWQCRYPGVVIDPPHAEREVKSSIGDAKIRREGITNRIFLECDGLDKCNNSVTFELELAYKLTIPKLLLQNVKPR